MAKKDKQKQKQAPAKEWTPITLKEIQIADITKFAHERIIEAEEEPAKFQEGIESLAESIRVNGMQHPIIVRSLEGDKFELIDGYRRVKAHEVLKLANITASVQECDEKTATLICAITNFQRLAFNAMDKADLFYEMTQSGYTHEQIAKECNLTHQAVTEILGLKKVTPEIQEKVRSGEVTQSQAVAVKDLAPEQQEAVIEKAVEEKLSASKVKEEAKKVKRQEQEQKAEQKQLADLERMLESKKTYLGELEVRKAEQSELNEQKQKITAELRGKKITQKSQKSTIDQLEVIEKLQKDITEKESQIVSKQSQIDSLDDLNQIEIEREKRQLDDNIIKNQKTIDYKTEQRKKLGEEITELKSEIRKADKRKKDLDTTFKSREKLKDEVNGIQAELITLEHTLIELENKHRDELANIAKLKTDLDDETKTIQEKQRELASITGKLSAINGVTKEIDGLMKEIARLESEIKTVKQTA